MAEDSQSVGQVPRVKSSQYRDIYANSCNVRLGPYDITATFGTMVESPPGTVVVEDQVGIAMSPQLLKAVVAVLAQTLQAYEQAFGAVNLIDVAAQPTVGVELMQKRLGAAIQQLISSREPATIAKKQPSKKSRGGGQH